MDFNDFRYMRRGRHLAIITAKDASLMKSQEKRDGKKRKALLALHGFSSSPAVFRELITKIQGYDALFIPLLPGHGDSVVEFSRIKAKNWFNAVEEICGDIVNDYEQVDILGLSLGGLLACHLSYHYPIRHLFLLAPALSLTMPVNKLLILAKCLKFLRFSRLRNAAGNIYSSTHCELAYRQLPISTIIEILTTIKQFKFELPPCPTDIFLGCHDLVVSSRRVAARFIECPHCEVHWLKNASHVIPLEDDLSEIIACINQSLIVP